MEEEEDLCGALAKWATSNGAKVRGIAAYKFPDKGLGIVATRRLEVGQKGLN